MLTKIMNLLGVLVLLSFISGCGAIATIFKGGMWFGVFMVVAVIGLLVFFLTRTKK